MTVRKSLCGPWSGVRAPPPPPRSLLRTIRHSEMQFVEALDRVEGMRSRVAVEAW